MFFRGGMFFVVTGNKDQFSRSTSFNGLILQLRGGYFIEIASCLKNYPFVYK